MVDEELEIKLSFGLPIWLSEKIMVRNIKIMDVVNMGVLRFYEKCFPFLLSLDFLGISIEGGKVFDFYWILLSERPEQGREYMISLFESIMFFLDLEPDEIIIDSKNQTITVRDLVIDRNSYDELSDIIRKITKTEKLKKERKPKSARANRYIQKREEYHKKHKGMGIVKEFKDMVNYLSHPSYNSYEAISNMTLYQAKKTWELCVKKENYENTIKFQLAGADIGKKGLEHWSS